MHLPLDLCQHRPFQKSLESPVLAVLRGHGLRQLCQLIPYTSIDYPISYPYDNTAD